MKQHYLPQCYLREFCNTEGKLYTLDLDLLKHGRKVFAEQRYPAEVCRSKDFYTIDPKATKKFRHLTHLDPFYLEKEFQVYEKQYPKLIQKIKNGQKALIRKDAELLLYAIIDMKIRNPYFRDKFIAQNKEAVIDSVISSYQKEIEKGAPWTPEGFSKEVLLETLDTVKKQFQNQEDYAKSVHISSQILRKQHQDNLHERIIERLLRFQWVILTSRQEFITTDNPGTFIDKDNKVQNTSFGSDFFFFMPLTPSLCLTITTESIDPDYYYHSHSAQKKITYEVAPPELISTVNDLHGYHLSKFVFSNNETVIENFAAKVNSVAGLA